MHVIFYGRIIIIIFSFCQTAYYNEFIVMADSETGEKISKPRAPGNKDRPGG